MIEVFNRLQAVKSARVELLAISDDSLEVQYHDHLHLLCEETDDGDTCLRQVIEGIPRETAASRWIDALLRGCVRDGSGYGDGSGDG